jgi:hypothetical protein
MLSAPAPRSRGSGNRSPSSCSCFRKAYPLVFVADEIAKGKWGKGPRPVQPDRQVSKIACEARHALKPLGLTVESVDPPHSSWRYRLKALP